MHRSALLLLMAVMAAGARPDVAAQKVRFTFTSDRSPALLAPQRILETVKIWPAADESNVASYNVYWGDLLVNRIGLGLARSIAKVPATGDGKVLVHEFPPGYRMRIDAIYILVCTASPDGDEYCEGENNYERITDDLLDLQATLTSLRANVEEGYNGDCPGLVEMETCGDFKCNGVETVDSCPTDCRDYRVASFNYQALCEEVQEVQHPTSVAEIQDVVRTAKELGVRVRVVAGAGPDLTTGSATTLVCTDGKVIMMDRFNETAPGLEMKLLSEFEGKKDVVVVAAGTRFHQLGEWLYKHGRGVGFTHLGWADASVAGAIGTSAHGSSPKHSAVLSQWVVGLELVDANGEVRFLSQETTGAEDADLWKAATTHLGYLGVVTRVYLRTEPSRNIQVRITFHKESELFSNFEDPATPDVLDDISECDYGQYNWFPQEQVYLRTCGKVTDAEPEEGARNRLLQPYVDFDRVSQTTTLQALQVGACYPDEDTNDLMERLRYRSWHLTPILTKTVDGTLRYSTDAVGPLHNMTSSHLIKLEKALPQMDFEVAVPQKHTQKAIEFVSKFVHKANTWRRAVNVPLIGFFIRFSKAENNTLMAYTGTGGDFEEGSTVCHIEFPIFVPVNLPEDRFDNYMAPYDEMMRTLLQEYGARGHWGKNQYGADPWVFRFQTSIGSFNAGNRLQRFSQKVGEMDPTGLFSNRYAKALGISYPEFAYPEDW